MRQYLIFSSDLPRTAYVAQDGLKHMDPPTSLGLQVCATAMPDKIFLEEKII